MCAYGRHRRVKFNEKFESKQTERRNEKAKKKMKYKIENLPRKYQHEPQAKYNMALCVTHKNQEGVVCHFQSIRMGLPSMASYVNTPNK